MRFLAALLFVICISAAAQQEILMKPIATAAGAGVAQNGLRATITPVKKEFGPGESIVLMWTITNEGNAPRDIEFSKQLYEFSFELKSNGKVIRSIAPEFLRKHITMTRTIEPGQSFNHLLDLREVKWDDKSWMERFGTYEVSVSLAGVQTGWVNFKVTTAGEKRHEISPELAEKLRTLIGQLGDNEFATREQAYLKIREIGKPALSMLEETIASGKDAEVVARCKKLVEQITGGRILPFSNNPGPQPVPPPPPAVKPMLPGPPVQPKPVPPAIKPPRPPEDLEF